MIIRREIAQMCNHNATKQFNPDDDQNPDLMFSLV